MGRAGNQMFQYAFARHIQEQTHEDLCIDFTNIYKGDKNDGWKNQLLYFHTTYTEVSSCKINMIQKVILKIFLALRKVTCKNRNDQHKLEMRFVRFLNKAGIFFLTQGYYPFHTKCLFQNKLIMGYFESEKYFEDIRKKILDEFQPREPRRNENFGLYKIIEENKNSVCMTVRAGDYINDESIKKTSYLCTPAYFQAAVEKLRKKLQQKNLILVVFSDNVDWCRENLHFKESDTVYFETDGNPVWEKLRLMSSCGHFIISNSSFSWWAQYLSGNEKKVVVAPSKWRNYECEAIWDTYNPNWLLVDV